MLQGLQQVLLDHVEPPLTWRYAAGVRIWPFALAAVTAVACAFSFLVATNYNSQTCARLLQFRSWRGPAHSLPDCQLLEQATGDWSAFVTGGDLKLLSSPLVLSSSVDDSRTYAPSQCPVPQLQATDMIITLARSRNDSSAQLFALIYIFANFGFEPMLRLLIRGFMEPRWLPFLTGGVMWLHSDNWTAAEPPIVRNSTFAPLAQNNTSTLFWRLLGEQARLMTLSACIEFVNAKHLMECSSCLGDSWSTIVWIIIIGCIQAVTVIDCAAVWCLRLHNRRHQLEPRRAYRYDDHVALSDGEVPFISLQV